MGVELIYHDFDDESSGSPFEDALASLSDDAALDLACPYLSRDVLESLTDRTRTWRLVTDVQEWFRAQSRDEREETLEFLQANRKSIHDCRGLHAKVLVGTDAGMVGSANLTHSGLAKNSEMSVLFEDTGEVDELNAWFDDLWDRTERPDEDALRTFLTESGPLERERRSSPSMGDAGPSIDSGLELLGGRAINVPESNRQRLVETVGEATNREWADAYFGWVREAIECSGLEESDERIATTVPKSDSKLPVNVNHRYVLAGYPKAGEIGLILPADSSAVDELSEFVTDFGTFSTDSDADPYWFQFPGDPHEFLTEEMKRDWRATVREESTRGDSSEYRRHHNPAAYRAAVDAGYREEVLDAAFPS